VSAIGWIIILVFVLPIIGLLLWLLLAASFVRVPSGSLGLVMVKGAATDKTLTPGPHFVAALRRHMIEEYPSVELAYRAGGSDDQGNRELNESGPPLQVMLGDRTTAVVSLTVRFRLIPAQLRLVHERFGPKGVFGIVRDECTRALVTTLGSPDIGIDSLFGSAREKCEDRLRDSITATLSAEGIEVTSFLLGVTDLGRTGEVIQATVRARYELEREQAEAATRMARALNDADLQQHMTSSSDGAWRYRETDLWRDLVQRTEALQVALRAGPGQPGTSTGSAAVEQAFLDQQIERVDPQ
jgi:regulator of protease activity HflC (stomatin/prohibitin superfamily)